MRIWLWLLPFLLLPIVTIAQEQPYIQVLGTAQDGGYPHLGCQKQCCEKAWESEIPKNYVVSLALVDPIEKKWWLFEATPDIKEQLHYFQKLTNNKYNYLPDGIFITHAHIGHYTGLMQLGREVLGAKDVPVYALPRLQYFLLNNGPWSQLCRLDNILIQDLDTNKFIGISKNISVKAFTVPHRDEYSETAGFRIHTSAKKYLFIPDIDKWEKWSTSIKDVVASVDIALVDATFYNDGELPNRAMSEVPHPFIKETIQLFNNSPLRSKVHFIHFNHTNPALWDEQVQQNIKKAGFHISRLGEKL